MGSFGFFNAYLVAFGLFLPKTEEKKRKKYPLKILKKILLKLEMWIRAGGGGGGQPIWIIFTFYDIFYKIRPKMWIKIRVFLKPLP